MSLSLTGLLQSIGLPLSHQVQSPSTESLVGTGVLRKSDFEAGVTEFATKLAKQPPLALKFAKQALNISTQVPTDLGQLFEAAAFGLLLSTKDANEGISAMLEKREPEFKGE